MTTTTVKVFVTPKKGVLDPQGKAIAGALAGLGFTGVAEVRQGKVIELKLENDASRDEVEKTVRAMCDALLANPVMEDYRLELVA